MGMVLTGLLFWMEQTLIRLSQHTHPQQLHIHLQEVYIPIHSQYHQVLR